MTRPVWGESAWDSSLATLLSSDCRLIPTRSGIEASLPLDPFVQHDAGAPPAFADGLRSAMLAEAARYLVGQRCRTRHHQTYSAGSERTRGYRHNR